MKTLTTSIFAFFLLIVGVSQVWALPNCNGYMNVATWDNCVGTHTYDNGTKYVGEWKRGKATGYGQGDLTYASGERYVGEFRDYKRHGQGAYTFANGDKYVGEYRDGNAHGQGTYTYANGSKDVGAWENDKLNGYAITYNADGSIHQEGIFKDDKFLYAQKKSKIDKHKDFCEEIGYTPKTEKFADCVLKLMDKD